MITIENKQVFSTEDKYIHRLGTETYFKVGMVLPNDKVEDFEEVDELPKYTEQEYKEKVQELISQRYSIGDEIALINNLKGDKDEYFIEYDEYMKYREECKIRAKEELNNK